jgi:hypothetical protein
MSESPSFDALYAATVALEADVDATFAQKDQTITNLNGAVALQKVYIAELEQWKLTYPGTPPVPVPDPPVPPPPVPVGRTLFGACPRTTVAAVGSKFGPTYSLREFDNAKGTAMVFERPADCDRLHGSSKLGFLPSDAQLIKLFAPFKDGDFWSANHEWDVKHQNALKAGDASAEAKRLATQQVNNACYDAIVRLRDAKLIPFVWVVNTIAVWRFSGGAQSPNLYFCKADYLGVDMDGTTTQAGTSYPDWASTTILANIGSFVKASGYKGFTVPEFGWPQLLTDKDGAKRIAAIKAQIPRVVAAGALGVEWFDNDSNASWAGYPLNAAETAVWKAFNG